MRQAQEEELKEKHGFVSNTSFGIMHCNTIMAYNNKNYNGRLCEKYLGGKGRSKSYSWEGTSVGTVGGGGESPSTNASLVQLIFFSWCNIYFPKTDEDNNY